MKKLLFALTVISMTALFPSCDPDTPDPKPDEGDTTYSTRSLLAKTVYTTGDTVGTTTYRYDAQNKLIWVANTSNKASIVQDTSEITRNAQGAITKIIYHVAKYNNRFVDGAVMQDVYLDATSKYTHKIVQYDSSGFRFKDSIKYTYDAQARISKEWLYYNSSGSNYVLYGTIDYVYTSGGDVTSKKTLFNNIGGTAGNNYEYTFTYTYDDKVNALNLGNEAIVLGMGDSWSGHNPLTITSVFPGSDAQFNQTVTYVYKYNTADRPLSADITSTLGGTKTTIVYTYQ